MPRNAQGLYTLPAGNPVTPGTIIESVWANTTMQDIGDALTGSLPRDGSAPMTGPLTLANSVPTAARHATSKAYVDGFIAYASGMPVGAVLAYAGVTVPPGYFECNGQAISRTLYPMLFAAIGVTYGSGDGSTTFNVPDMRDEFIRGKSDSRAIGSKQAAAFASHTHAASDPGHVHGASQNAHSHTTAAHNHSVNDPGHAHSISGDWYINTIGGQNVNGNPGAYAAVQTANTNAAGTGISINTAAPDTDIQQPAVSVASAVTGLTLGAAGGDETRPQNIAQIYIIKAAQDSSGPVAVTGVTTSDAQMISVDNTLPNAPDLVIHSNVAFGTVKLDASGKVPQNLVNISTFVYLGPWDASGGQNPSQALPSEVFENGDLYQISVGGTIQLRDSAGVLSSTPVVSTDQIVYVTGSTVGLPDGWYFQPTTAITGITAGAVAFTPTGSIGAVNVQDAIVEVANESVPLSHVGSGGAQHANVVASGAAGFMTGADKTKLDGIQANAQVNTVQSVNSKTGAVVLTASDVGALTQAGADSLYVNVSGDTMSGPLALGTIRNPANTIDAMTINAEGKVAFPATTELVLNVEGNGTGQPATAGQSQNIKFPVVVSDPYGGYNVALGQYVIPKAGLYAIGYAARCSYGAAGGEVSGGVIGGTGMTGSARYTKIMLANEHFWPSGFCLRRCNVGDVIALTCYTENAATLLQGNAASNNMQIMRIPG